MAIEPTAENLLKLQTEITMVRAQHQDLVYRVRRRELVESDRAEKVIFNLAHRIRDHLLTAPARHAAIIAAELGLAPGPLAAGLEETLRQALSEIAASVSPAK
jgi:siderophore synthetase component